MSSLTDETPAYYRKNAESNFCKKLIDMWATISFSVRLQAVPFWLIERVRSQRSETGAGASPPPLVCSSFFGCVGDYFFAQPLDYPERDCLQSTSRFSRKTDRQKKKSGIPYLNFGESRFPGSSQIPNPVKIFCVCPNPAPFLGQIQDPENTLPDPDKPVLTFKGHL